MLSSFTSFNKRRRFIDKEKNNIDKFINNKDKDKDKNNNYDNDDNDETMITLETAINTPISLIHKKSSKCISQEDKSFTCNPSDKKNVKGKYLKYSESNIIKRELEIYKLLDKGFIEDNIEPLDKDGIFHIKNPDTCNPSSYISDELKNKCLINNSSLVPVGLIMILKEGGIDLEEYSNKCIQISIDSINKTDVQLEIKWFWVRCHDIIYGLYIFHKNGLMHYSINPGHILFKYDILKPDECKMYLINYSKTRNRSDIIYFIENGESGFPENADLKDYPFLQLYNYPPETFLLNADQFRNFIKLTTQDITELIENLSEDILTNGTYNPKKKKNYYAKSFFDSFFPFMQYTMIGKNDVNNFSKYMKDFNEFLITISEQGKKDIKNCYTKILELNLKSFDSYGFGLSMLCVLKRSFHLLQPHVLKTLNNFFYNLVNPNVFKRNTNILSIMLEYEDILYEINFLDSVNHFFNQHILTIGNKVDNPLLLPMESSYSDEHYKFPTNNPYPIDEKNTNTLAIPNERYTIIYNYIKHIVPFIIQYYASMYPGQPTENQLINYLNYRYPKTRIQNDIINSSVDKFVNIISKDNELATQYENLVVDLQQIESSIKNR